MGWVFQFFILLYIVCTIKTGRSQSKPQLTEVEGITVQPVTTVRQLEEAQTTDNQPNYRCALIFEGAINRFMVPTNHLVHGSPVWQTVTKDMLMSNEFLYLSVHDMLYLELVGDNDGEIDKVIGQSKTQPMENNCFSESPFRIQHWDKEQNTLVAATWVYVAQHPVNMLCRPSVGNIQHGSGPRSLPPTDTFYECAKQVINLKDDINGVKWNYSTHSCDGVKGSDMSVLSEPDTHSVYSTQMLQNQDFVCVFKCNELPIAGQPGTGQMVEVSSFQDCVALGRRRGAVSISFSYSILTKMQCFINNTSYYMNSGNSVGCDLPPNQGVRTVSDAVYLPPKSIPIDVTAVPSVRPAHAFSEEYVAPISEISSIYNEPLTTTTVAPSNTTTVTPLTCTQPKSTIYMQWIKLAGAWACGVLSISMIWCICTRRQRLKREADRKDWIADSDWHDTDLGHSEMYAQTPQPALQYARRLSPQYAQQFPLPYRQQCSQQNMMQLPSRKSSHRAPLQLTQRPPMQLTQRPPMQPMQVTQRPPMQAT